ncbi:MAG: RNA methyltransferase [Paludibacteraceae bacterium]|nr:RNA methyltransferase [Paludibacteraceae bacterium]
MISKAQLKTYRSLHQKKYRDELGLFLAEGSKCVDELRKAFELEALITEEEVGRTAIEQLSSLRTPQGVIAVFRLPSFSPQDGLSASETSGLCSFSEQSERSFSPKDGLILALDGIQDPGNLGTIIRTCDWFGVRDIVCSLDTADCFNPKVVQATMGALARVRLHYVDLPQWLTANSQQLTANGQQPIAIYGTLLEGRNMYEVLNKSVFYQRSGLSSISERSERSIIIMGNEGNGISPEVRRLITHPIRIPSYPPEAETSESLNVAIATAIVLAEFRRP